MNANSYFYPEQLKMHRPDPFQILSDLDQLFAVLIQTQLRDLPDWRVRGFREAACTGGHVVGGSVRGQSRRKLHVVLVLIH